MANDDDRPVSVLAQRLLLDWQQQHVAASVSVEKRLFVRNKPEKHEAQMSSNENAMMQKLLKAASDALKVRSEQTSSTDLADLAKQLQAVAESFPQHFYHSAHTAAGRCL